MRYVLSIMALCLGTPALAQSEPARPAPIVSVQEKDGLVTIRLKTPGIIHLCATSDTMDVSTTATKLVVRGGTACEENQTPSLVLNTSPFSCGMLDGRNTGNLIMNCTGGD